MNPIIDLLKTFFEKGFIKTLISLASAGVSFSFTPNDFFMIDKLSKVGYFCLLFFAFYLLVEFLHMLLKFLYKATKLFLNAFWYAIKQDRKAKELWETLDKANDDDREIVMKLLETNNTPIQSRFGMSFTQHIAHWFEKTRDYTTLFLRYSLKDEEYQLLKSSMQSYIKKSRKRKEKEEAKK